VVTDLITPHTAWRYARVDEFAVPSASVRWRCHLGGIALQRCHETGLPVGAEFAQGPAGVHERRALRRDLALEGERFVVVLTGGGEGSGGIARRAKALIEAFDDITVVAICGRNAALQTRLHRLAHRRGHGRLVVKGFVANMADWLRAADVVVSKAGPGTIAEATCCGAPLLLTSHVPGQEKGNTEFVVGAGAGRHVPGVKDLVAEIGRLRHDPNAVDAMRLASARVSRPHAAAEIAALVARATGRASETGGLPRSDTVVLARSASSPAALSSGPTAR
jgi:1,2-diacylglycerol 3-beta-galactosyltransferase